jgi:hypothetical protein
MANGVVNRRPVAGESGSAPCSKQHGNHEGGATDCTNKRA